MHEIRVWRWEYTDAAGRRRVSRWLMTEREALRYRDAVRLQHTYQVIYDRGAQRGHEPFGHAVAGRADRANHPTR